jgi:glycine/D-amino acid oxidase-like deaminating enzyme
VITAQGEEVSASLVIVAAGALGQQLCADFAGQRPGQQPAVELVALRMHLVACEPDVGRLPFWVPDAGGFNHLPHAPHSIFGSGRTESASHVEEEPPDPRLVDALWKQVREFFPGRDFDPAHSRAWAGTTVQAMRIEQIEPGHELWPAVVDHRHQAPSVDNLLSIFPGRATLWPHLAEETRQAVLSRLDLPATPASAPPWRQ